MPQKIDKTRVYNSFLKSLYSYNRYARLQGLMADELVYKLRMLKKSYFETALEIGAGTGLLTERLLKSFRVERLYTNDLVGECRGSLNDIFSQYPQSRCEFIAGDIEEISNLPGNFDVILSNATFQWLEDFEGFLPTLERLLKAQGLLAFSTFGPRNLQEIRHLTGNTLMYPKYPDILTALRQHFEVLSSSEETVMFKFSSPQKVLKHLRFTGVNGLSPKKWTKSLLRSFEERYWELFGQNHQVSLTYHPIFCVVKK